MGQLWRTTYERDSWLQVIRRRSRSRQGQLPGTKTILASDLKPLEDRSYATYRARLEAAKRLSHRGGAWNASLIATTSGATIASIALIKNPQLYGAHSDVIIAGLAVITLVASLTVANQNYAARSRDQFYNYRAMQKLSVELESLSQTGKDVDFDEFSTLLNRYNELLDSSENHTSIDHYRAQKDMAVPLSRQQTLSLAGANLLNSLVYITFLIPLLLIIPLTHWLSS